MKKVAVFIFISLVAFTLWFSACRTEESVVYAEPQKRERLTKTGKKSLLDPAEFFQMDRNYPDYRLSASQYTKRLQESKYFDQTQTPRRDLDYPWTMQGPGNIGGRVNAVAVHPQNPEILFLGYSQGGVYRTDDGGETWHPVFDDALSLSIAHISFDTHDPDHMLLATGDVNISGYYWLGSGVYESYDAGMTWKPIGLASAGVLSKVWIDPHDSDVYYAGSMGVPAQKGDDKGFYRSVDGGDTWQKTLHIDDSTGIIDIVTDPVRPGRLFATSWTRIRSNTVGVTVGPGTGVYRSEDYGATWENLSGGLPDAPHSRTSIEITNDGRLFVSYVGRAESGECAGVTEDLVNIYTSFDSGDSWDTIPGGPQHGLQCGILGGFGWYFEAIKVNPADHNDIYVLGVEIYRTRDGGFTWLEADPFYATHADKHDLVFAHDLVYLGTDGGAYLTDQEIGNDWIDIENIPSTQYYRTTFNPHQPDYFYGGAQDNGTTGGNGSIFNEWEFYFGGDGFQPMFDPNEPNWMYVLTQNGNPWFSEDGPFGFQWLGSGLTGSRYWDMPLVMSVHNSKKLYCGSHMVHQIKMDSAERVWVPISPDLTRGEFILGGRYPAITAIAESALDSNRLFAGTQDGLIWMTSDGGRSWINITEGTPGFFITSITTSTTNPRGVVVTYSGYRDNDHTPYIYRSDDAGQTWTPLEADLPMMGVNNLMILPDSEDEVMIIGTDGGVYVTLDAGLSWHRVGNNMPYMPVYDIDYNPVSRLIIAATFSRGIMTFPVEELEIVSSTKETLLRPEDVAIYPSVVHDHVIVEMKDPAMSEEHIQIKLLSRDGQYFQPASVKRTGEDRYSIQLADGMAGGLYFVTITAGRKHITKSVVVL